MSQYRPDPAEELIRRARQFWGRFSRSNVQLLPVIGAIIALTVAFTSFYTVEPEEEAVVLRFGAHVKTSPPGLHFKMPLGIDRVYTLQTQELKQEEFGFRTRGYTGDETEYITRGFDEERLILTGDLNVADVTWVVQYRIEQPLKYLFNASDPVRNVRDVSESVMRRSVGDRLVSDILTIGRTEISEESRDLMQELLDEYDLGIRVVGVQLQDVNPPSPVQGSYHEVNMARQQQESMINQAEREYNRVIPAARGKAKQTINEAEGYAQAIVNRSRGDASRFNAILTNYQQAPVATRRRLYIETMEELLQKMGKVTIVDDQIEGLLPIFGESADLSKLGAQTQQAEGEKE